MAKFDHIINLPQIFSDNKLAILPITRGDYVISNFEAYHKFEPDNARQTNYYTDAARYLGLLERRKDGITPLYALSETGKRILNMNFKQRQLAYCDCVLSHKAFGDTLRKYFENGNMPSTGEIIEIMKQSCLYNVESDSTFERRSSTIKGWLNWIVELINE